MLFTSLFVSSQKANQTYETEAGTSVENCLVKLIVWAHLWRNVNLITEKCRYLVG